MSITKAKNENHALMDLDSDGSWSVTLLDTEYTSYTKSDDVYYTIAFKCSPFGIYSLVMQEQYEPGDLHVKVVKKETVLKEANTNAPYGVVSIAAQC